jgi:hemolysin III
VSILASERLRDAAREIKPKLRGWLHLLAFPLSLVAGAVLVIMSNGERNKIATAVFAVSSSLLFGSSALFHRGHWSPRWHGVLRRLDHSTIFLLAHHAGCTSPSTSRSAGRRSSGCRTSRQRARPCSR